MAALYFLGEEKRWPSEDGGRQSIYIPILYMYIMCAALYMYVCVYNTLLAESV